MTDLDAKKELLVCPGDTIQETLDEIGMSQADLAQRMGRSVPKVNDLIRGKAPITKETATKLEHVLNIPAQFWLNLERRYQDEIHEIERLEFYQTCIEWLKKFPIKAMKEFGLLPATNDHPALVEALLKFFRIASPVEWSAMYCMSGVDYKIDLRFTVVPEVVSVWLRIGELEAEKISLSQFNERLFKDQIPDIQELAYLHPPDWADQLQNICAAAGVALVYAPCMAKAPVYGATRWIKNNSVPLIQMTNRYKTNNAFWFSFFHEAAHILFHGKKETFLDGLEGIQLDKGKEDKAGNFASRKLIKESQLNELLEYPDFSDDMILSYSEKWKIHPGILVAQIQRKKEYLYNNARLNKYKVKIEFTSTPKRSL